MRSHALGITTNLDSYVYAFSRDELIQKVKRLIDAFNDALEDTYAELSTLEDATEHNDLASIKWTGRLKQSLKKAVRTGELLEFDESRIREVLYRPFLKKWLYEDYRILSAGRAVSEMFPASDVPPPRIIISTPSDTTIFCTLASNRIGDLKSAGIAAACRYIPWRSR
ncbi:type ISP restriction/modification enzyme [Candidatus Poriferisocius sp.]|uniref:type ISP restriction/modification enzyme n=1 Tax=Candidatus Poriferisocius sp. TaxID=3101276 RepID=UPI003B01A869